MTDISASMTAAAAGNPARRQTYPPRSAVISWIFFDWAAQPYFTLITTFVFAPYFATSVAPDPATGQSLWGFTMAAAGMLIAQPVPDKRPIRFGGTSVGIIALLNTVANSTPTVAIA